ncbi:MAG TPA: hypothetical protein VM142_10325 [Acidimicrobiales bacterium]|nr:hypothetical protein [Acidimicrobiales bacterium]
MAWLPDNISKLREPSDVLGAGWTRACAALADELAGTAGRVAGPFRHEAVQADRTACGGHDHPLDWATRSA